MSKLRLFDGQPWRNRWLRLKQFVILHDLALFTLLVLFVLAATLILVWILSRPEAAPYDGVYVEAWGSVFDLIVVGLVLSLFTARRERRLEIRRHEEEIDDYKRWDSEEARVRMAGSIRRLAGLGKFDLDLVGVTLPGFKFAENDIHNLAGSNFHGALWSNFSKRTNLNEADFSHVDCTDVVFSRSMFGGVFMGMKASDIYFYHSSLVNARFEGADLTWSNIVEKEADWYEYADDDPQYRQQVYAPAFEGAVMHGASFRDARLDKADFRGAIGVTEVDFTNSTGLDTCFFDEEDHSIVMEKYNAGLQKRPTG